MLQRGKCVLTIATEQEIWSINTQQSKQPCHLKPFHVSLSTVIVETLDLRIAYCGVNYKSLILQVAGLLRNVMATWVPGKNYRSSDIAVPDACARTLPISERIWSLPPLSVPIPRIAPRPCPPPPPDP